MAKIAVAGGGEASKEKHRRENEKSEKRRLRRQCKLIKNGIA